VVDKSKSIQTYLEFLRALREDPAEANYLRVFLKNGASITIKVEVEDIGDRLELLTDDRPRLSLISQGRLPQAFLAQGVRA
jgi:hypothetical protein